MSSERGRGSAGTERPRPGVGHPVNGQQLSGQAAKYNQDSATPSYPEGSRCQGPFKDKGLLNLTGQHVLLSVGSTATRAVPLGKPAHFLYLWGLCQSLLPPPGCAAAPGARGSSWGTQALPVCITPAQCLINCRQEGRTGSREGRGGERGAGQGEVAEGGSWQPCLCGPTNRAKQLLAPGRTSPSGWHRTNLLAAAKGLSNTRTGVR